MRELFNLANLFNKSYFFWINFKCFCQPAIVEFNAFIFEEFVVIRIVEYLNTKHDKTRIMATSDTNIVKIIESNAELGADEGIGGRVKLSSHAVGLEAIDTSGHIVHVVSPSGDDGVALDGLAWDAS